MPLREDDQGHGQTSGSSVAADDRAERLEALLRCAPDFVYFKDAEGGLVSVSQSCAAYWNAPADDLIGKTDFDLLPPEEAEELRLEDRKVMESGEPLRDRLERRVDSQGADIWISVTKIPWRNGKGEIIGIIGICRELTDRIEGEKHILDMLSIATHDIRGPLMSIASTIKLVTRGAFGVTDESVRVTLSDLSARINHLEKIVSGYLCKSSLMNVRKPHKEHLDLRQDIIDPILGEFASEIEENRIRIDNRLGAIPSNRIIINANAQWLRVVYRNLIRNAIKYAPSGVIAFGFEDRGDHYRLNVYNSGPPVPPQNRAALFERFESKNSTGLGLAISRNLILKHGGDMWYENTWDNHPNFVFTIPG